MLIGEISHFAWHIRDAPLPGRISRLLFPKTIAAIDGTVTARLKGNLAGLAALGTYGIVHGALTASAVGGATAAFAGIAAGLAALGLVGKTFFREKFLLAGREGEVLAAILAGDRFVLVHEIPL